jgi:hypothetical protein
MSFLCATGDTRFGDRPRRKRACLFVNGCEFNSPISMETPVPVVIGLLRLWVRIPQGAWMCCCECCVLSRRGLCDELITRPEKSSRLCCVVCDYKPQEWPAFGPQRKRGEGGTWQQKFDSRAKKGQTHECNRCQCEKKKNPHTHSPQ